MADVVGSGPGPYRVEESADGFVVIDESTGRPSRPYPAREQAEWWITTQPTPVKSPPPPVTPTEKPDTSNPAGPVEPSDMK
jgi:hypothetical protein